MKIIFLLLLLIGLVLISGCTQKEETIFSENQLNLFSIDNDSSGIQQSQYIEDSKSENETSSKNNIDEPSQQKIKNIKIPGYTELIDVSNGLVVSLSRDKIVYGIDINDPSSPKVVETIDTSGFAEVDHLYLYHTLSYL